MSLFFILHGWILSGQNIYICVCVYTPLLAPQIVSLSFNLHSFLRMLGRLELLLMPRSFTLSVVLLRAADSFPCQRKELQRGGNPDIDLGEKGKFCEAEKSFQLP